MTIGTSIPLVDLVGQHQEMEEELVSVFRAALKSGRFVDGTMVSEFEREFAAFCEVEHCVGVGSGTDALRLALIAAGVNPGDTVITVPNTFIATTEAISQAGARFDFVDIDPNTYTMDPEKLWGYLDTECMRDARVGRTVHKRTGRPVTAIVPVHLYGHVADMDPIVELAAHYNLMVIEDACQAQGALYFSRRENRWWKAGSMGIAAAFSFYPGKNLGACGEAGAVTTNEGELAQRVRMLKDHGQCRKYYHETEGYNGRLDAIQAGLLSVKLKHLREWNDRRREVALRYSRLFVPLSDQIRFPLERSWASSVYHLYVIRVQNRGELQTYLDQEGIATGIHYPIPLHLQSAYGHLRLGRGSFPVAEMAAEEILSLPICPRLKMDQQDQVVQKISAFVLG